MNMYTDDAMVRRMIAEMQHELTHCSDAKRGEFLRNVIKTYDALGSTPELVKYAHHLHNETAQDGVPGDSINVTFKVPVQAALYINDLRRFLDAMSYKLAKNAHKGRWEDNTIEKAMEGLVGELHELNQALRGGNTIEIMLEAADVANYAMIIASITVDRGK